MAVKALFRQAVRWFRSGYAANIKAFGSIGGKTGAAAPL